MNKRPFDGPWLRACLIVWIVAPIVAIVALTLVAVQVTPTGPSAPSWVPARTSDALLTRPVDVALIWSRLDPVRAPSWSGLVQSVDVEPGSALSTGTRIATIDGTARIAAITPAPFYRSIASGDFGADVGALNALLAELELPAGDGDSASWKTSQGIQALSRMVGANQSVFDPAWIVFVPSTGYVVASVDLTVASPAPGAGSVIVESAPALTSATVISPGSLDAFIDEKAPNDTVLDPAQVARIAAPLLDSESLTIDESTVDVDDSGNLAASALPAVGAVVTAGAPLLRVNALRDPAADELVVPSGALYVDDRGSTCVLARSSAGTETPTSVVLVSTQGEQSIITSEKLASTDLVAVGLGTLTTC